jgi:hypothetical protein
VATGLGRSRCGWERAAQVSAGATLAEVAAFEAIAVAFKREDLGVVDEPVDHGGSGDVVAQDLTPRAEGLGRDDKNGAFIAAADEHEHELAAWG